MRTLRPGAERDLAARATRALLLHFSPWTVGRAAARRRCPAFIAETKFSGDAFRLFRWRSPETRMQMYLETVLAREDHAKEVKLFGLGPRLLQRYRDIFTRCIARTARSRSAATAGASLLGLVAPRRSTARTPGSRSSAVAGAITLGEMTMYLLLFRQGQSRGVRRC